MWSPTKATSHYTGMPMPPLMTISVLSSSAIILRQRLNCYNYTPKSVYWAVWPFAFLLLLHLVLKPLLSCIFNSQYLYVYLIDKREYFGRLRKWALAMKAMSYSAHSVISRWSNGDSPQPPRALSIVSPARRSSGGAPTTTVTTKQFTQAISGCEFGSHANNTDVRQLWRAVACARWYCLDAFGFNPATFCQGSSSWRNITEASEGRDSVYLQWGDDTK